MKIIKLFQAQTPTNVVAMLSGRETDLDKSPPTLLSTGGDHMVKRE